MSKQSVLITGCSEGGIGHALAQEFASRGYQVYATARDVSKIGSLAQNPHVQCHQLDVTNSKHISEIVAAITKDNGQLNYLINNAGRNHFMPILDENLDDARKIFESNYWGPLALIQAFMPLLLESKGMVVNITSISGYVNVPYMGVYAGSKRALEIAADTLRLELEPFGVGVLNIVTGVVQSKGQTYFEDLALPEDSLYKAIEQTFVSRAQGGDGYTRMPAAEYAKIAVDRITSRVVGRTWLGNAATSVKWSSVLAPQSVMDSGAKKGTGLDVIANK